MVSPRFVHVRTAESSAQERLLRGGIAAIRDELQVSEEFPAEVLRTAEAAAASPRLPDLDRTDLELVTIDPPGARDLDQALHIARDGDGFTVHYAIADLGAFITPGDVVDVEANLRGQTLYGADSKIPLHPPVLSEDAGSLLPGLDRPSLLWTIRVGSDGVLVDGRVERAMVRSREQMTYDEAQEEIDGGNASQTLALLAEVGPLRMAREAARGGVSLPLPEQEIAIDEAGNWQLEFRRMRPVEEWNAQISLLTGIAAARMMVENRVGIVRTLPPADDRSVQRLRRTARGLGIEWPVEWTYPEFVRSLDPASSKHAAMVVACTRLFRGSGYEAFVGEVPDYTWHAAVASDYAHVTAPLRRLVDRYAGEVCVALSAGESVPEWVLDRLPELPATMRTSGTLAGRYEREVLNLTEAVLLAGRVGEKFTATVLEVDEKNPTKGDITIADPAVEARVTGEGELPLGESVDVVLTDADPVTRTIRFALP